MIPTVGLANASITSHNYHFFSVVRIFQIQSLSTFEVYNSELSVITKLCFRSSELIYLLVVSLYP